MQHESPSPLALRDRDRALDWLTAAAPVLLLAFAYYRWPVLGLALLAAAGYAAVYALLHWAKLAPLTATPALAAGAWLAVLFSASTPLWVAGIAGMAAAIIAFLPEPVGRKWPSARPLLHPVLAGYLLVRWVFPDAVQAYTLPALWASADAVPASTALAPLTAPAEYDVWHLFLGVRESALGTGCVPVLLLAALYLLVRRRLRLIAPAAMLATVAVLSQIVWAAPLQGVLVGTTVVGALLLADRACVPAAYGPQAVTGVVAGGLTVLCRALIAADGCAAAVLAACLLSPLYPPFLRLCRWLGVRIAGWVKKLAALIKEKICKKQK
ncbi:MAG: RnfABCDGE type electron transport complex subunit D [Clostridia bacterium]|nr:RnfABCDGE type electron transport complex subunit D [Clostridia bacterium]